MKKTTKKSAITTPKATKTHNGGGLSTRWTAAIDLLVAGKTITTAAAESGCSREQLSRLKNHNPVFIAELNRCRSEARQETTAKLRGLINKIIDSVEAALQSPELSPYVTLQAGLSALPKLFELVSENEQGYTSAEAIAGTMVSTPFDMLDIDGSKHEIAVLIAKSTAELETV